MAVNVPALGQILSQLLGRGAQEGSPQAAAATLAGNTANTAALDQAIQDRAAALTQQFGSPSASGQQGAVAATPQPTAASPAPQVGMPRNKWGWDTSIIGLTPELLVQANQIVDQQVGRHLQARTLNEGKIERDRQFDLDKQTFELNKQGLPIDQMYKLAQVKKVLEENNLQFVTAIQGGKQVLVPLDKSTGMTGSPIPIGDDPSPYAQRNQQMIQLETDAQGNSTPGVKHSYFVQPDGSIEPVMIGGQPAIASSESPDQKRQKDYEALYSNTNRIMQQAENTAKQNTLLNLSQRFPGKITRDAQGNLDTSQIFAIKGMDQEYAKQLDMEQKALAAKNPAYASYLLNGINGAMETVLQTSNQLQQQFGGQPQPSNLTDVPAAEPVAPAPQAAPTPAAPGLPEVPNENPLSPPPAAPAVSPAAPSVFQQTAPPVPTSAPNPQPQTVVQPIAAGPALPLVFQQGAMMPTAMNEPPRSAFPMPTPSPTPTPAPAMTPTAMNDTPLNAFAVAPAAPEPTPTPAPTSTPEADSPLDLNGLDDAQQTEFLRALEVSRAGGLNIDKAKQQELLARYKTLKGIK